MLNPYKAFIDGDRGFAGVNLRLPVSELPAGIAADAENARFRYGVAETRKGVVKLAWLHQTTVDAPAMVNPFTTIYGAGVYRDPNSTEWVLIMADGVAYRTRENNAVISVPLPTGVKLLGRCKPVQAFNKIYLFRGKDLAPLVLSDLDTGFTDIVAHWSAAATYALNDEVAFGPLLTISSLTSAGNTATVVTTTPHGFVSGADVTVFNATQTEYNVRANITVIDDVTFTYPFAGSATSPATTASTLQCSNMGTYYKANQSTSAGESPDTAAAKWDRIYNILPNADDALYVQNRLLVPTAYSPGGTSYGASSDYGKKDYLVATDVLDEVHFDFVDDFRINQGSDDEIVGIQKFGDAKTVLVLKGKSWGVLAGMALDLSNASLDMRNTGWGQLTFDCSVVAGQDAFVLVPKRGVVSIRQTETNAVQSVDLPLSDEIQPLIERINWTLAATKARMAYWDNKLYVAVPLDSGELHGADLCDGVTYGATASSRAELTGFVRGQTYRYTAGSESQMTDDTEPSPDPAPAGNTITPGLFVATADTYYLWDYNAADGASVTATVEQVFVGVNTAVLVYDFLTKRWCGTDTGLALGVKEFFKATRRGVERLFFAGEDGFISMMEESMAGDQVASDATSTGLTFTDIVFRLRTRGYPSGNQRGIRVIEGLATLATWNPSYTAQVIYDGASESGYVDNDGATAFTKDRTKYVRPFDAADYDATNANDDFLTPYRQDYSVPITSSGLTLGSGIQCDLYQEAPWTFAISPRLGRYAQIELRNVRGRMQVKAVELTAVQAPKRKGTLV